MYAIKYVTSCREYNWSSDFLWKRKSEMFSDEEYTR